MKSTEQLEVLHTLSVKEENNQVCQDTLLVLTAPTVFGVSDKG